MNVYPEVGRKRQSIKIGRGFLENKLTGVILISRFTDDAFSNKRSIFRNLAETAGEETGGVNTAVSLCRNIF